MFKFMTHIEIPIWNKCNNKCVMCTNRKSMRESNDFKYDTVIKYLDEQVRKIKGKFPQDISLTGGETTICPYFFQVANYIQKKFPQCTMNILTNGRLFIYNSFRKRCLSLRKTGFIIPLHAHHAELHDRITQTERSFDQTWEGLKKLVLEKNFDQKVEIRIIITRLNFEKIPEILKLIKKNLKRVDRVVLVFQEFEGMADLNKNSIGVTYEEVKPILRKIKGYFKTLDLRLYHFPLCFLEPVFWPYVWRTLPEGEITFLPICQNCTIKKYCLGIHKSYLNFTEKPEVNPYLSLMGIRIAESGNIYNPIKSAKIDKVLNHLDALNILTDNLMSKNTEPTKYFFTSMFFKLNQQLSYNAKSIKQCWRAAVREIKEGKRLELLNLYVHIPFCDSKCNYCMYPSIVPATQKEIDNYLKRIAQEFSFYKDVFSGIKFTNIYIGGGSPSSLSEKQLTFLLSNLTKNFKFLESGERNFECNPSSTTLNKLKIIEKFNFNRISFGVQSLDGGVLLHANRGYQNYKAVEESIRHAQSLGFRVNVDLMIGLHKDTPETVRKSFHKIIKLRPDCVSLYPLKPSVTYLEKFCRVKESVFYDRLNNKVNEFLKLAMPLAEESNYTCADAIFLSEGYCGNFVNRDKIDRDDRAKLTYYNSTIPYSFFGVGYSSVSKIIGLLRYYNQLSIHDEFDPSECCYKGNPSQMKEDMREYILNFFSKGLPVSQKNFKEAFGCNLTDNFPYTFSLLKRFKKIKIDKDLVYFLPRSVKEMFMYGLFFWDKQEILAKLIANR